MSAVHRSELTARIKGRLRGRIPGGWIEGEISNLRGAPPGTRTSRSRTTAPARGACSSAGEAARVRFELEDGLQVWRSAV